MDVPNVCHLNCSIQYFPAPDKTRERKLQFISIWVIAAGNYIGSDDISDYE